LSDVPWDRILEKLDSIDDKLEAISKTLEGDRANLWKVLLLTIAGAFALVGIKLLVP